MTGGPRADRVVTSGVFRLDGGEWEVENNIWLVGDDSEVLIIDAAHDAAPIKEAVGGRRVLAVALTHAHNDHITVAPQLSEDLRAPILLHPEDDMLWQQTHPGVAYSPLAEGQRVPVAGSELRVIHTPGHSPGSVCLFLAQSGLLFSGDTLFCGGPGATGRSYSDFPTIIASIRDKLLALPGDTRVLTGHGDDTTISAEAPRLGEQVRAKQEPPADD